MYFQIQVVNRAIAREKGLIVWGDGINKARLSTNASVREEGVC